MSLFPTDWHHSLALTHCASTYNRTLADAFDYEPTPHALTRTCVR